MTKITTKTLSRYKSLFTVLLALLLLVVAVAPVSAALTVYYGEYNPSATWTNFSAGQLDQSVATIRVQAFGANQVSDISNQIVIQLPTGLTFNTTHVPAPAAVVYNMTMSPSDPTQYGPGKLVLGTLTKTTSALTWPVNTPSNSTEYVNISGIYVDVSTTASAGPKLITISTAAVNPTLGGINVTKPQIVFSHSVTGNTRMNVTAGGVSMPGGQIAVNSTAIASSLHPNGEIGVGYIYVTLPTGGGITFDGSSPGVVATNTSPTNTYGVGLTVTNPPTVVDAYTLRATVTVPSNTTSSYFPNWDGGLGQWVNFTGYRINVSSTVVNGTTANFTIKTTPTGGNEVSQDSLGGVIVVKPVIRFNDASGRSVINVTAGGIHVPGGVITINSSGLHPDGEIGNNTFIRITLPADAGITFDGSSPGVVTTNTSDINTYGVGLTVLTPVVSSGGLELKANVTKGSNSTSSRDPASGAGWGGQWVNFSGFRLNVTSGALTTRYWNYTIYTQNNITLSSGAISRGTEISTETANSISVVKPNVTSAGVTVYLSGVENKNVTGGAITINSTDLHPDGEIGNNTFIRIRIPAGIGVSFNGSAPGVTVTNTSDLNTYGVGLTVGTPFVTNFTDGLELNMSVTKGSNSTSSLDPASDAGWGGQWVNITGFKLNVTSTASSGNWNFTVYTQSNITLSSGAFERGTEISQTVTGINIQTAIPDTVYPVSPNGIYENPILVPVGTSMMFNWTVYSNGTTTRDPYVNKLVNFLINSTTSAMLNTSSMTTSTTGNVSVVFTAPTTPLPVASTGVGGARYLLNATVNGYPLVLNQTNIAVVNQSIPRTLKVFPDVTRYAPNGIANVTVWARDDYGNNQTSNGTVVRLSSTDADVQVISLNNQVLVNGNYTYQIKKSTPGIAHLYVQNDSTPAFFPMASAEQTFIGDIGSIVMTSTKSSLVADEEANLSVQLKDVYGNVMALSGQTIAFTALNVSGVGCTATVTPLINPTDTSGIATAYIKANAAGISGTIWANATVTNQSLVSLTSTVPIALITGLPANQNSTLTASSTTVLAGATSTISALIRDSTNNVISGQTVNFAITTSGGSLSNSSLVTNAAGYANVTLTTNTIAGTNTVQATSATGNVSKEVSVTGTAGTATKLGFTTDTPSSIGVGSTGTMKAQLLDSNGNLVATTGTTVNFTSSTAAGTLSAISANTVAGIASVTLTGSAAGTTDITASSTGLTSVVKTITVQSATGITLTPDKTLAAATGSDTITVTLQLIDSNGAPLSIAGSAIAYSTTSGTLSVTSGTTGATGANVTTITSTTVGQPVITAQINGPSNTTTVTFSGNATTISVTATPTTATINNLITVNVQAKDAVGYNAVIYNGLPITGQTVLYGYPAAITATNSTNFGATGAASVTVTSGTANTYTITATGVGKSGSTPVTFTIAPIASNVGVFRDGVFYLNGDGYMVYGLSTDTPIIGNWDGTGDNAGVWRNNLTTGSSVFYLDGADAIGYGIATDTPIVGDWNGDGKSEIGVWRSSATAFYLRNTDGTTTTVVYGLPTDIPVIGDWNGDLISEVGVYRDGVFYLNGAGYTVYGVAGDEPIIGDWNGDLISEVGVWRNSAGSVFYRNGATVIPYGLPTDTPVIGKWA